MTKESKFWGQMRDNFNLDWLKRVENSIEPGWPDVHYMQNGCGGWIELKAEQKFPSSIKFEPAQPLWLSKYWRAGGNSFVFLKVIEENKVYVWAGLYAMELDKPKGCHDVKPMLEFSLTEKGWGEANEMFNLDETTIRYRRQNP